MAAVLLVTAGAFGRETCDQLSGLLMGKGYAAATRHVGDGQPVASALADEIAEPGKLAVLLSWREATAEVNEFERAAFRLGLSWLPVLHHHPVIRVGPVMRPDTGPCYVCCNTRLVQHDPENWPETALDEASGHDARFGVSQLAPHLTAVAAGLAMMHLDGMIRAGRGVSIHVITERVAPFDVVPVDGCRRCGDDIARHRRSRRRTDEMARLVQELGGVAHAG